ncbi:MAG: hypothetical protein KY428_06620 [Bacteroidetes bacterium]|nr:hypothetical protein [Bacteroidota bacterium]
MPRLRRCQYVICLQKAKSGHDAAAFRYSSCYERWGMYYKAATRAHNNTL